MTSTDLSRHSIAESLLQLTPQDSRLSLDFTNSDLCKAIGLMIPFWRRHHHQLDIRQVARHTFDQAQQ